MSWNDHEEPAPQRRRSAAEKLNDDAANNEQERMSQEALAHTIAVLEPLTATHRKRVLAAVQAYYQAERDEALAELSRLRATLAEEYAPAIDGGECDPSRRVGLRGEDRAELSRLRSKLAEVDELVCWLDSGADPGAPMTRHIEMSDRHVAAIARHRARTEGEG